MTTFEAVAVGAIIFTASVGVWLAVEAVLYLWRQK